MSEDRFKEVFWRLTAETPDPPAFSSLDTHDVSPARPIVFKPWTAVAGAALVVLVVVGAVGLLGGGGPNLASPAVTTTTTISGIPSDCPVTFPTGDYTPPEGYPAIPSTAGTAWIGSDDLWTLLSVDGDYQPRKSVWWSVNFPGGSEEEQPPISVTYELLNVGRDLTISSTTGTNAYTPGDGWFMIANVDPQASGCWRVTASYKGATLSYVYYTADGTDPIRPVPDVVGMTVEEAKSVLLGAGYDAAPFDSDASTYEVCAQEPGAGQEILVGSIIGLRTAPPGGCAELMSQNLEPNADYEVYEDQFGRLFYATACPNADVVIGGGLIAADGLPQLGQTWRDRVQSLVYSNVEEFLSQPGVVSVSVVPRNGYVWSGEEIDDVVVSQEADYMIEVTVDDTYPCPSAPFSWNGIPVAFILEN